MALLSTPKAHNRFPVLCMDKFRTGSLLEDWNLQVCDQKFSFLTAVMHACKIIDCNCWTVEDNAGPGQPPSFAKIGNVRFDGNQGLQSNLIAKFSSTCFPPNIVSPPIVPRICPRVLRDDLHVETLQKVFQILCYNPPMNDE